MDPLTKIAAKSYAKINLGLAITGVLPDGYHELFTTFQAIDLYDSLLFEKNNSGGVKLACDTPEFPLGAENLIVKAIRKVEEIAGHLFNLNISVKKRIPIAAGLGGGSSNAAAAIKAVNVLYDLNLSTNDQMAIGRKLGADVPFFLGGAQAEGRGRGDELTPLDFYADYWVAIIKPSAGLSTAKVYNGVEMSLTSKKNTISFSRCRDKESFISTITRSENALEAPALRLCPEIGQVLSYVHGLQPVVARVSGSGPSVFGVFICEPDRKALEQNLPGAEWSSFMCCPLRGTDAVSLERLTG